MTYIAATSPLRPPVGDRTFNYPSHSCSPGPTNVQQNCSPLVPSYHPDLPIRDPLHLVSIPLIDTAEFERYDLYDPRDIPVPSSPNRLNPLLEQSPYNISYANQPRLHQTDEMTPVTLPAPGPPGFPYASAPLMTQRPRSPPEPTNVPLSVTSAFHQTRIQPSIHLPSTSRIYPEFGGIAPALSAPSVPLQPTVNQAADHSNPFHHSHRVTDRSSCNARMQLGIVRSVRGLPYNPAPLTTHCPRSLPESTNVLLSATSVFHQTRIQPSIQPPLISTAYHEFGGTAPALSAPPVPLATANPAADHLNTFRHPHCVVGGSPRNTMMQLGTVRSVRLPYDPAPRTTHCPRSLLEPTNVPLSATSAFHQTRIQPSIQPPSTSTTYHRLRIATALSAPLVPPTTANSAADHSNTLYHCQFVTGGSPCNVMVLGNVRSVRDHLNWSHEFRGAGKDMVECLWMGCERRLQRESIPRHIVTCHLRVGVRCGRCGLRLSRSDVQYSHAKVCHAGRPTAS